MKRFIAKSFPSERAMTQWLIGEGAAKLKAKYPPPRYSAAVDFETREVFITDRSDEESNDES